MKTYGYARVSTKGQNLDRQLNELRQYITEDRDIITDKESGKDFNREGYQLLKNHLLREGDTLIVYSLDRLGRNYTEIQKEWRELSEMKVGIKVLDMPLLDTTQKTDNLTETFIADLVLQVLSYVADNERRNIRARQEQGIEIAKKQGVKFGRPKTEYPEDWEEQYSAWKQGKQTAVETWTNLGLTKSTFYRLVKSVE